MARLSSCARLSLGGLILTTLSNAAPAQRVLQVNRSFSPGSTFGHSIASIEDLNGDGLPDWIAGLPNAGFAAGEVRIVTGRVTNPQVLVSIRGTTASEQFGWSVDTLGDVDNDGVEDWMASAPRRASGRGEVEIRSGRTGQLIRATSAPFGSTGFGHRVRRLADVDGDGVSEYAVADRIFSMNTQSSVAVFSGRTGVRLARFSRGAGYGDAIEALGDVDGDGVPDLAIGLPATPGAPPGTPASAGRVFVISYATGGTYRTLFGLAANPTVASAGDLTGDGVEELFASAPGTGGSSEVRLLDLFPTGPGSLLLRQTFAIPGTASPEFGSALARIGDVDLDGVQDLLVGDPAGVRGTASVFSTATGALLHTYSATGLTTGFGRQVAVLGDIEGDGVPEMLVSAPGGAGEVHVLTFDFPGQARRFGQACGANGTLSLSVNGSIAIGRTITLTTTGLPPAAPGTLLIGASNTIFIGLPLPLSLSPFLPSCSLFVSGDITLAAVANSSGTAMVPLPLPNTPALISARFYAQYLGIDPLAGSAGLAMSDATDAWIGY